MLGVLWIVLKILGILLAVLLALVLIVLFLPITVKLHYEQGNFTVSAGTLGLMFQLLPQKEKKKTKKPKAKKCGKKTGSDKPQKVQQPSSKKLHLSVNVICELVRTAGWLLGRILAGIRVHDLRLRLPVHGSDAADTAIQYGKTNAWLYSALGVLQNGLDIRIKELALVPDFNGEKQGTELFSCKITSRLIIMLVVGVRALMQLKKAGVL